MNKLGYLLSVLMVLVVGAVSLLSAFLGAKVAFATVQYGSSVSLFITVVVVGVIVDSMRRIAINLRALDGSDATRIEEHLSEVIYRVLR